MLSQNTARCSNRALVVWVCEPRRSYYLQQGYFKYLFEQVPIRASSILSTCSSRDLALVLMYRSWSRVAARWWYSLPDLV